MLLRRQGVSDESEILNQFNALDQDNTGFIKYSEFIAGNAPLVQFGFGFDFVGCVVLVWGVVV